MPDEIIHLDGVGATDWALLSEIAPVYVCRGEEYEPETYRFLVTSAAGYTLIVEVGGRLDHILATIPQGNTHQRKKAVEDYKNAGAHYLERYRLYQEAETERLKRARLEKADQDDWTYIGHDPRKGRGSE